MARVLEYSCSSDHLDYFSRSFLRWVDPVAATFDSGILQVIIVALVGVLVFNGVAFAGIFFNFHSVFVFYREEFKQNFNQLTTWQKTKFLGCLYLGLLFSLVLLAAMLAN